MVSESLLNNSDGPERASSGSSPGAAAGVSLELDSEGPTEADSDCKSPARRVGSRRRPRIVRSQGGALN